MCVQNSPITSNGAKMCFAKICKKTTYRTWRCFSMIGKKTTNTFVLLVKKRHIVLDGVFQWLAKKRPPNVWRLSDDFLIYFWNLSKKVFWKLKTTFFSGNQKKLLHANVHHFVFTRISDSRLQMSICTRDLAEAVIIVKCFVSHIR